MGDKTDVLQGTLALMVLTTLDAMGPLHGYGIARRIEQMSGNEIQMNQGTLYPALVKLEQQGWIRAKWGVSDNNRRAKFYAISPAGRRQLAAEAERWSRVAIIVERFLKPEGSAT
jgi:transcriptional regulator